MYRKKLWLLATILLGTTALLTLLGTVTAENMAAPEAPSQSPFVTVYPLPNEGAPRYLLQANDGFWFTAPGENAIGQLVVTSTTDYEYTFYPIPTGNSTPYDLTWDGTHIWFTELTGNKLGKLHPASGAITEYTVPTSNSEPSGITVGPDDTIWFVERSGNNLTSFDTVAETFTEHTYSLPDAQLEDVAFHPSNNRIWFTAAGVSRLGWYNLNTGAFDAVSTVTFGKPPYTPSQLALDNRGDPWVSTVEGRIGRFAASTVQLFRWYRVGAENSEIHGLIWQADGNKNQLWFTEANTGYVGQLLTEADGGTLYKSRFPVTGESGQPFGLTVEENGTIWIADSGNHRILSWSPPYVFSTYLPSILRP